MALKVLLTTSVGWPSVARLAHGFAAAGCSIEAHAPQDSTIFASRYVGARYPYKALSPQASLRAAIEKASPDLLVACDDRAVAQILALHDGEKARKSAISALIATSLGEPSAYRGMMSRNGFMQRAKSLGIRIPETRQISNLADLDLFLSETGLPVVLKADGSWGGDGVVVARTRAEACVAFTRLGARPSRLRSLARAVRRKDAHYFRAALAPKPAIVSAQSFVVGRPAASAFACWKGEIVGAIYYDVLIAQGEIGPPNVIRRVKCPQMEHATRTIARHYGLSGIHGMDFLRDPTGAVHLIEINPRATQGSTLPFGPGADLPAALANCLQAPAGIRPAIENDVVAIFPREWQRDPASPWLRTAHHDVPWDDPAVLLAALRGTHVPAGLTKHDGKAVAA